MSVAFVQNAILSLIVLSITFSVVILLRSLNQRKAITTEVSRKVTHLGAGTLYLAMFFYNDDGFYSKYFNIFPYLLWTCILFWKGQTMSSQNDSLGSLVRTMTRTERQSELLRGPLFFNFVTIVCGTIFYKKVLGSIIMANLTWGDGLAAVVGTQYGGKSRIFRTKSWHGCLTMFLASFCASIVYSSILVGFQSVSLVKFSLIALISTVTETLSPSDFDNLTVPLSIFVTYFLFF